MTNINEQKRSICRGLSAIIMIMSALFIVPSTALAIITPFATTSIVAKPQAINNPLATQLGWVTSPNPYNLCGGYYKAMPISYRPSKLVTTQKDNYNIESDQYLYSLKDRSALKLKGHVKITQTHRELTADAAHAFQDKKGKVKNISATGNVKLRTQNAVVLAEQADFDTLTQLVILKQIAYRITSPLLLPDMTQNKIKAQVNPKTGKKEYRFYQLSAQGTATQAAQTDPDIIKLKNATYTTCSPICHTWHIKASNVTLNAKTGRGQTVNTRLFVHNIPIFYLPYFNFPIDKRRQTGFLFPSYGNSSRSGPSIEIPYYLNLAPNYDLTITPDILLNRGILWHGLFRYLTPTIGTGNIQLGYIASDREFQQFKKDAKTEPDWIIKPTFNRLQNSSDNRWSFAWTNYRQFNPYFSGEVNYNYVSDDYYIQDFGHNIFDNNDNQLLQQAKLTYHSNHWGFLANFQHYQTLHPVNQDPVYNQYARLPQLQLNGHFLNQAYGFNYTFLSDFTYFYKDANPEDDTKPIIGNRLSIRPAISRPFNWSFAYLIPRLQLQLTKYDVNRTQPGAPTNPGLMIPITDVKAGLYFDRTTNLFSKAYQQTLEPMLYYLYVPYRNQDRFPFFDTTAQTFSYDMMFQDNRFSGIDRIGDTNRFTLGLTTRFIDKTSGLEKADASIGQMYYIHKRRVTLCYDSDCKIADTDRKTISPFTASGSYYFNPRWNLRGGLTWDPYLTKFDNENIGFQYKPNNFHIINIGYEFVRGGDRLSGAPADSPENDLEQTDVSTYWKINDHWSFMGRWNYNLSHKHAQAFFYGFAYESCCWALRLIASRTYVGLTPHNNHRFDNGFYVQFIFKGLGSIAYSDPNALLNQSINGYVDNFGAI